MGPNVHVTRTAPSSSNVTDPAIFAQQSRATKAAK